MAEQQQDYKPKRTFRILWRRFRHRMGLFWTETFLPGLKRASDGFHTGVLPGIAIILTAPLLCILIAVAESIRWIRRTIDEQRRYCPLHNVRFRYEALTITPEQATLNQVYERQRRQHDPPSRSGIGEYNKFEGKHFHYANCTPPQFTEPGIYYPRYCLVCREAKRSMEETQPWLTPWQRERLEREKAEVDEPVLRELEELERRLGLVPEIPKQVSDTAVGNQEAKAGDL